MPVRRVIDIDSEHFCKVGYDPQKRILVFRLRKLPSILYVYAEVPPELYTEFLNAASMENFFNDRIRSHFTFDRIIGIDAGDRH